MTNLASITALIHFIIFSGFNNYNHLQQGNDISEMAVIIDNKY